MNMKMQSVGFKADSKLEAFINQKLKKLEKLENSITTYDVILNVDKASNRENKVVEVKMQVPGSELFAKKQSKTFEEATDLVADALRSQILRYKEKR
ncbi:ribosome-associated translation inhibitor RaiA [Marinifilum breve]|uniref:Ribosome-associated translation inhibitor RaiA n=1 Tax=Marinifilum breve TaxID=2184082 RepID=A0A2V4A226_9BACT|nr:ribosome-associated translation inhibitor RaiA [Marinifilum breve]PXY01380.1 ribosome-associated translation inhibitor RaiA [Marinifilum breve]